MSTIPEQMLTNAHERAMDLASENQQLRRVIHGYELRYLREAFEAPEINTDRHAARLFSVLTEIGELAGEYRGMVGTVDMSTVVKRLDAIARDE